MSVTKLRESTEKKGCQVAVWIIMVVSAIGVAGAGFFGCFSPMFGGGRSTEPAQIVILEVDGQPVTLGEVSSGLEGWRRQFGTAATPDIEFQLTALVLNQLIEQKLSAAMAEAIGIRVSREEIIAHKSDEIDDTIRQFRLQAIQQADLKESATEAEFQTYFKEKNNETTADFKKRLLDEVNTQLDDPQILQQEESRYANQTLEANYAKNAQVSDEEIKKSFKYLMLRYISFEDQDKSVDERESLARQAIAELEAGADFEAVQKKYMKNPIKDPIRFNLRDVEASPEQKALAALKNGQHSQVITEFGIPRVYQLAETKDELPADFEANKSVYGEPVRQAKGRELLAKALEESRKAMKLEWKSPGFEAIYAIQELATKAPAEQKAALKEMVVNPTDSTSDPAGTAPASLARFGALRRLEALLTADEKKELGPTIIEIKEDMLNSYEDIKLRLELVDHYRDAGNKDEAGRQLLTAAENNSGFEQVNVDNYTTISTKLNDLVDSGVVADDMANQIRTALSKWNLEKSKFEEEQKRAEEEAKKAAEELDKLNNPDADKANTTTGGTAGGKGN